jgi:NitT/TauT family transport system permease protein
MTTPDQDQDNPQKSLSKGSGKPDRSFYEKHDGLILGGSAVLIALTVWQIFWSAGLIDPLFLSGPSAIATRFADELNEGRLTHHLSFSAKNFLTGFSLATLLSVPLGILLGWYRIPRLILDPFINGFYATPRIAFIPLIIMWFGIGLGAKIFIVFLSVFFPILINTIHGVKTTDPQLLKAARSFCASEWEIFRSIVLPCTVPFIVTGIRQGVAHGLIGVVIGEFFVGSDGIGYLIGEGGTMFETDLLFVGVVVISFVGIVMAQLLNRVTRYFDRWRSQT